MTDLSFAYAYDPWRVLQRALLWQYGAVRAASILAAKDPQTNADLQAWRALGTRRP